MRWNDPKVAVCVLYVAAMFMNGMDATIVNVALPAIGADYGVPPSATSGVNIGYLVALAVCIPASGWLGDRFGTKKVFLSAFGAFVLASALCGAAQDITQLTLARVLQGAGGGVVSPVALTMLFRAYPPQERIRLSRVLVIPTAVAPALGPVLGGWFVEHLSWRWGFFVNVPFGVLALVYGVLRLTEHVESVHKRFDVLGFALAAPGLALVMYALETAAGHGPASPRFLVPAGVGLACLVALVIAQVRTRQPMLDLRLFADASFRRASLILGVCVAGFLGTLYGFTLMYQSGMGASAWETGLVTLPKAIGLMLASQAVTWAHPRMGPRALIAVAMLGAGASFAAMNLVSGPATAAAVQFASGFFVGAASIELQVVAFATISATATGGASTLFNVQRQIGSALGVAITAGVLAVGGAGQGGSLAPYHAAMLVAAGFALVGALLALRIKNPSALGEEAAVGEDSGSGGDPVPAGRS